MKGSNWFVILALAGLGIMITIFMLCKYAARRAPERQLNPNVVVTILMLQGFGIGGFYLEANVLIALVLSLSAISALRVLGKTGSGAMAPRGR